MSALLVEQGKERAADLQLIQSSGETYLLSIIPLRASWLSAVYRLCLMWVGFCPEITRYWNSGGKLAITDLYVRDTSCEFLTSNSSGIMTYNEMIKVLMDHGFEIMIFEDQSRFLREFVGEFYYGTW